MDLSIYPDPGLGPSTVEIRLYFVRKGREMYKVEKKEMELLSVRPSWLLLIKYY